MRLWARPGQKELFVLGVVFCTGPGAQEAARSPWPAGHIPGWSVAASVEHAPPGVGNEFPPAPAVFSRAFLNGYAYSSFWVSRWTLKLHRLLAGCPSERPPAPQA